MCRMLIVDSDIDRCKRTRTLLNWSAYGISSIATATSYVEAVDKAMDMNPQIAFVSIQLGSHMGYELVEHLCSVGLKTFFCMIADSASPQLLRECMRAGARDYFLCPLDAGEVLAFLDRMTANRRNENLQVVGSVKT